MKKKLRDIVFRALGHAATNGGIYILPSEILSSAEINLAIALDLVQYDVACEKYAVKDVAQCVAAYRFYQGYIGGKGKSALLHFRTFLTDSTDVSNSEKETTQRKRDVGKSPALGCGFGKLPYFIGQRVILNDEEIGLITIPENEEVPNTREYMWVRSTLKGFSSRYSVCNIKPLPNGQF